MTLQHVNIKIMASKADIDLTDAIAVFHHWIQQSVRPELLIDVADYRHVPDGPGVMLIGHQADYSLDEAEGRLGVLYNRKSGDAVDTQTALRQAFESAVAAAKALEAEPVFNGKLIFDAGDLEVIVNDRIVAPNNAATWEAIGPEIEKFFGAIYKGASFALEHRGEARERFRVGVKTSAPVAIPSL